MPALLRGEAARKSLFTCSIIVVILLISNVVHYIRVLSFLYEPFDLSAGRPWEIRPFISDRNGAFAVVLEDLSFVFFDCHFKKIVL